MDVSVIIVSWNTKDILKDCLASVYQQTHGIDFEVIVVDNASCDGSAAMVRQFFPDVQLIENTANRGFAAANNQAMALAKGRYVLLLNSDTIVLDNAIAKAVDFADANPDVAVTGCRVLNPDGSLQPTCFMFPSVLNMVLSATYLYKLFPRSRFFGRERMTWWNRNDQRDVEVVTGCMMLVRSEAINHVGVMDERYFMYCEEADWCYRFRKAGWRVMFTPTAQIIHLGGQSSRQVRKEMLIHLKLSVLKFIKKHHGWLAHKAACLLTICFFVVRMPIWFVRSFSARKDKEQAAVRYQAYRQAIARILAPEPSVSGGLQMNAAIMLNGFSHLLTKRYLSPFWLRRRELEKTQWLSPEEIERLQFSRLKKLLAHCHASIPYYRNLMDEQGIAPDAIESIGDIERFPILTKRDVFEAGHSLVSRSYPAWMLHTAYTGGSTGPRLPIKRNPASIGTEHAFLRRQYDWAGIGLRDCCAYLTWRSVARPNEKSEKYHSYDPFMKELILSTFHLCEDIVPSYIDAMKACRAKALVSYPSAALVMARALLDRRTSFPLVAVLTSSETLGQKERLMISQAFECPVYDFYGNAERVCAIHTCDKGSYHIIPEYGLTELVRAEYPNEDCFRIIATGFWNNAMPLVRYDTGDLVKLAEGDCPCGRRFPMIKSIVGRECKTITTASGRTLGLTAISRLFKNALLRLNGLPVAESQFILNDSQGITFEFVPRGDFNQRHMYEIRKVLGEELPADVHLEIKRVSMSTRTPAGKSVSLVHA